MPKGLLDGQWNLILQACAACNSAKAALEDDVSAITMHPMMTGWQGHEPPELQRDALRKAQGSIHRSTGKPVADSSQKMSLTFRGEGMWIKVSGAAPPQIDMRRAFDLALLHWRALFYLFTYDENARLGKWWVGTDVLPVAVTQRGNWGNPLHLYFMDTSRDWTQLLLCSTAKGCFKASLKSYRDLPLYAFAAEWNDAYRVCGFVGTPERLAPIAKELPVLKFRDLHDAQGNIVAKHRGDTPLPPEKDTMFVMPDEGR